MSAFRHFVNQNLVLQFGCGCMGYDDDLLFFVRNGDIADSAAQQQFAGIGKNAAYRHGPCLLVDDAADASDASLFRIQCAVVEL